MIIIDLALATICFTYQPGLPEECHPVLIGADTPTGTFVLNERITDDPGYGGNVLQFKEDRTAVYAIHRVYLLNPKQNRAQRLRSSKIADRKITMGCVNVDPAVFDRLLECCSRNGALLIK